MLFKVEQVLDLHVSPLLSSYFSRVVCRGVHSLLAEFIGMQLGFHLWLRFPHLLLVRVFFTYIESRIIEGTSSSHNSFSVRPPFSGMRLPWSTPSVSTDIVCVPQKPFIQTFQFTLLPSFFFTCPLVHSPSQRVPLLDFLQCLCAGAL